MKILSNFFRVLAAVFWIAAIFVLFWQVWDWLSYGAWTMLPIRAAFSHFPNALPIGDTFVAKLLIWNLFEQPLLLALALIGLALNGIGEFLDR